MKDRLWPKGLIAGVVAAIMLSLASVLLMGLGILLGTERSQEFAQSQIDAIQMSMSSVRDDWQQSVVHFESNTIKDLELKKTILQSFVTADGYTGPTSLDVGAVVRVDGDVVTLLTDAPEGIKSLSADQVSEIVNGDPCTYTYKLWEPYETTSGVALVSGSALTENTFYLRWTSIEEYEEYLDRNMDEEDVLNTFEEARDGAILVVDMDTEDLALTLQSSVFPGAESAKDLGLTREMIEDHVDSVIINGKAYFCLYHEDAETNTTVLFLSNNEAASLRSSIRSLFVVLIMSLVLLTLGSYALVTQAYVRDKKLNEARRQPYAPKQLLRNMLIAGGLSILVVFASSCLIQAIGMLREQVIAGEKTIDLLLEGLDTRDAIRKQKAANVEEGWYVQYGQGIADVLAGHLDQANKGMLADACRAIGADYLMVFDSEGNEIACSADYVGFTLGMGQGEDAEDFKRLLYGIPSIVHEVSTDETTGTSQQFIGITIPAANEGEMHGALIMAMPEHVVEDIDYTVSSNEILAMVTPFEELALAANGETGEILYSSDPSYIGDSVYNLGFEEASLQNGYMDFDWIQGDHLFVMTEERDGTVYYYAAEQSDIFKSVLPYGFLATMGYIVISLFVVAIVMFGYTKKRFETWCDVGGIVVEEDQVEVVSRDGRVRRTTDPTKRWKFSLTRWKDMLPFDKTKMIFVFGLAVLVINVYQFIKDSGDALEGESLVQYILEGSWMRGFNLFALCAILIVCSMATLMIIIARELLQVLSEVLDNKGETLCRLTYSLLRYAIVLGSIYHIFGYLGFDTKTRLASLGIVSLALSFGAQALVADVIAGISIVFEGSFRVGDIVEIDGYRGTVQEIGVRTTKLLGRGDNIKIINNNVIKNVINLTRLNSWYPLEVKVPASESLDKIEEILQRELPGIGDRNQDTIISGPYFKGVTQMTMGNMTLSIIAECHEEDYHRVGRILNAEVQDILRDAGIDIK